MEPRFENEIPQAEKEAAPQEAHESNVTLRIEKEAEQEEALLDGQKEQLLQKGQELGLEQSLTEQVLQENGYTEKQGALKNRMRRLAEAISLSVALGAPMMAQAQNTDVEKLGGGVETVQTNMDDVKKGSALSSEVGSEGIISPALPEETEPLEISPETPQEENQKVEEIKDEKEPVKQEGGELERSQEEKERQEIKSEAADKRFALAQEVVAIVLTEGAMSPKAMEKLLALAGKTVKEEKEMVADMVAARVVPYYDSLKKIVEAAKGSKFSESKPLEGFDRLSHFLKGVAGVAMDSSQLGNVGRLISKLNRIGSALDKAENTAYLLSLLKEIEEKKSDPAALLKLLEKAEGGTMVGKVKKGLEDSARGAYDKITEKESEPGQKIAQDNETQPYAN